MELGVNTKNALGMKKFQEQLMRLVAIALLLGSAVLLVSSAIGLGILLTGVALGRLAR